MILIAELLTTVISIIILIIFMQIVIHWLVMFEVLKINNPQARNFVQLLDRFTDKFYRPLRRFIPLIGGIDITPVVVIIGLQILSRIIWSIAI